ncbi:MAG: ankyrin repeat domain-containing protein [Puniceicoccales bacterium]|nr:ankyrin repeat domain-containing protein [Puniceicoccales bacterium]
MRTAARNGDLNGVKELLEEGAQINDLGPKSGLTALDHAEDAGHRIMADYLRSQGGRRASEV